MGIMALLLFKAIMCLIIATFWYGAYDAYKHSGRTKGVKVYMVIYTLLCALMVIVVMGV